MAQVNEHDMYELFRKYRLQHRLVDKLTYLDLLIWLEAEKFGQDASHLHFTVQRVSDDMLVLRPGGTLTFRSTSSSNHNTSGSFSWSYDDYDYALDRFDDIMLQWRTACAPWVTAGPDFDGRQREVQEYENVWKALLGAMHCVDEELDRYQPWTPVGSRHRIASPGPSGSRQQR